MLLVPALFMLSAPQSPPPFQADSMQWRCIGPYRGGRTVGIDGVWSHPNTLFIGVNNGGVWRTTDYGHTWQPIFDDQPTGSVGCLAVAQSDPNTIYVGSGEGLQRPDLSVGDGLYKTTDGGKTWTNTGLKDGRQISSVCVDPKNANRAFVAVLGHPYGPNEERGIYRTSDGGKKWERVLYKDANTGGATVVLDPKNPKTVYASLWAARQAPWENGGWAGKTSGLFKSTDGGDHWSPLTQGLPTPDDGLGRIGISVCTANPKRIFTIVDSPAKGGIYRSDDAGQTWTKTNNESRIRGRGDDFAEVRVDPQHPDTVYVANTSVYKSTDGGVNYTCIKGAPGGDDFHTIWISPNNSDLIGLAADQGATISVNGGETWSSWYNQPTAQFYHVSTDNAFPYNVYGGQQESGSAGVASRGRDGQITFREWHPVGAEEYAYVAPDPLDPNIIYGSKGSRYDRKTGKVENVRPTIEGIRYLRTAPMLFSQADPHTLYLAGNRLMKTTDGGKHWDAISPDLSRKTWDVPTPFASVSDVGKTMAQRGVIYAVGPSPLDVNITWCGTDDGLVWVTRDGGKNWDNVTPPGVTDWSKVSQIDAGHFDKGLAYVSVNRLRCDDLTAYVYRTGDYGKTWTRIDQGLPSNAPVNAVREDPEKAGLLYAATETQVWFSPDDGQHWNSLRLNMPASSIRDLVVKGDDLVVGTHGRSFWILDSIGWLRDIGTPMAVPKEAYEVEWNLNTDTPLPPEEPAGKNPPDGVPVDYLLTSDAQEVKLEIVKPDGLVAVAFSSKERPITADPKALTVDQRWVRRPPTLVTKPGLHRFVWDMRGKGSGNRPGMAAIWFDTPLGRGTFLPPGDYRVRLTVDGKTTERPIRLKPDPTGVGKFVFPDHDDDGL